MAQYPNPPAAPPLEPAATGELNPEGEPVNDRITELLNIGPVQIRPRASYSSFYDDNIFLNQSQPVSDYIQTVAPAISISSEAIYLGKGGILSRKRKVASGDASEGTFFFGLDYTPSFIFFTQNPDNNTIDHRLFFKAGKNFERLSLDLTHTLDKTADALIETGGRTSRLLNSSGFNFLYQLTGKISWDGHLIQSLSDYAKGRSNDTKDWSTINWLNYIFSAKIDIGPGVTAGYSEVEAFPNSTYEQVQARIRYRPTPKLTLNINAGMEFRQFRGDLAGEDLQTPIFGAQIFYNPTPRSGFGLTAKKELRPSNIFADQVSDTTSIEISGRQLVWQRVDFSLAVGYSTSAYTSSTGSIQDSPSYSQFYVQPSIVYNLKKYWSIALLGQYRQADATRIESFTNTRIGITAGFKF